MQVLPQGYLDCRFDACFLPGMSRQCFGAPFARPKALPNMILFVCGPSPSFPKLPVVYTSLMHSVAARAEG